jgi:hypothetical protein
VDLMIQFHVIKLIFEIGAVKIKYAFVLEGTEEIQTMLDEFRIPICFSAEYLPCEIIVEAPFFCQQQTKPEASETSLRARNPLGPVICGNKKIRRSGFKPLIKPKVQNWPTQPQA